MTLQKLLGIDLPIVQAPMAGAQGNALAIAVSNAGGLGSLPCAMLNSDAMRKELAAIKAQTTKPFNVNFFCHAQPVPSVERETVWRAALSNYFGEYGIEPSDIPMGPGRLPFSAETAEALSEFKPAVGSFHFGLPSAELLSKVAVGVRRSCLRQRLSTRRAGSRRMGSTRSSRKGSRQAAIVACFCQRIWPRRLEPSRWCHRSCGPLRLQSLPRAG